MSLRVHACPGDNNCLFHALAWGARRSGVDPTASAASVRAGIMDHLASLKDDNIDGMTLSQWVAFATEQPLPPGREVEAYMASMRRTGTWGGEFDINLFAWMTGLRVHIYADKARTGVATLLWVVAPRTAVRGDIALMHTVGAHYDAAEWVEQTG
jgi:hypothetical protein